MTAPTSLGPVMFDLAGLSPTAEEKRRLLHPAAGGIILFSRNYQDPDQLAGLIAEIRSVRPEILIAVDHEGGRVQRFRTGFTRLPPAAHYRLRQSELGAAASDAAETAGWLMAAELRAFGVDFSFAPVLDVDSHVSEVIGDRAFADDPAEVAVLAGAFLRGMRRAGMPGVGKHFPGHGCVAEDSHLALPVDGRHFDAIDRRDLAPFRTLIDDGLEAVMPAHVLYPACDDLPAGYSPFWIGEILRRRLGFSGVVFSDDLSMGGAGFAGTFPARAAAALSAGCDMVLICNAPDQVDAVLDAAEHDPSPGLAARLQTMRGRFAVDRQQLQTDPEWRQATGLMQRLTESAMT